MTNEQLINELKEAITNKWNFIMTCNQLNRENICTLRRWIAEEFFKLDTDKDYFELSTADLVKLKTFAKCCGYNGRNYLGRSKTRQFWYHLQKGNPKPF